SCRAGGTKNVRGEANETFAWNRTDLARGDRPYLATNGRIQNESWQDFVETARRPNVGANLFQAINTNARFLRSWDPGARRGIDLSDSCGCAAWARRVDQGHRASSGADDSWRHNPNLLATRHRRVRGGFRSAYGQCADRRRTSLPDPG